MSDEYEEVSGELEPIGEEVGPEEPVTEAEVVDEDEPSTMEEMMAEAFANPRRTRKFSPNDAELHLSTVQRMGHIYSFKRVRRRVVESGGKAVAQPVKFAIETVPTRYDHYHDPEARGTIILTTREVMAFIEGIYAATRLVPASGDRSPVDSLVEGERWHPTSRAGDFFR